MPIPDFQSLMLPLLRFAQDGTVHSLSEAREALAKQFNLSEEEQNELLPSGRLRRFTNRVSWAKVYLEAAGLIESPQRAHFQITHDGIKLLSESLDRIDIKLLAGRYEQFRAFRGASKRENGRSGSPSAASSESATPEEMLEHSHQTIREDLAADLLKKVKGGTPQFFETLVVELLLRMGYGGSRADAGHAIGRSGDEGIDGIISEDRLGLDAIYIQAKKWDGTVGRPEIQKFVGALHGKRAKKGVFITTGVFSADAKDYVSHIDPRVVLIDGRELAEYMIDLNVGVTSKAVYEVKRIDSDYFVEE
jgi:restriction system protein